MEFDAQTLQAVRATSPEILRYIEQKHPQAIQNWNDLGKAEYARAFTVAGTAGHNIIGDIYRALLQVIEQGGTEADFADLITPILQERGWLADRPGQMGYRVQLIYDTNLRVARAVGRWQRIQDNAAVMPYLRGVTAGDNRVREAHRPFHGIVLPVQHWFWQEFFPPMFFRCRCDVIQMTRGQFARRNLSITSEAEVRNRAALIRPQSWGINVAVAGQEAMAAQVQDASGRVPGGPPISADQFAQRGNSVWTGIMALALQQLVTGLVESLADV